MSRTIRRLLGYIHIERLVGQSAFNAASVSAKAKLVLRGASLSLFLLPGCATPDAVTVRVPVPTPCVSEAPTRPTTATDAALAALDDYALVISLALDRRVLQGYSKELEALVEACR